MRKTMALCTEYIKRIFPHIDEELQQYIQDVLRNGADDFEDCDQVYEAIGKVLQEISVDKRREEIKEICRHILGILKQKNGANLNDSNKVLEAPVHLAAIALESNVQDIKSIWSKQRDHSFKVDAKKLEKAEAKLQKKLEKRARTGSVSSMARKSNSATTSQPTNKKETKLEAKGLNRTKDIHIENFDIAYADRVLLEGADMMLAFGRRYGLLGRNGHGKTTLLRMIAGRQLRIPSHLSVLHVEQEVIGDETPALQSVLQCDEIREELLKREKEISSALNSGSTEPGLNAALSLVYAELEHIEADKAPARVSVILNGLGFSSAMQVQATKLFSGGWRMRLALARALFSRPDLLLLDEPTNMLDIKAIIWLENYLQSWPTTLLVASHDRHFLDTVPTDILYLHSQKIETYRGNYEQFVKTKTEKHRNQQREYDAQQQHRAHVQIFIDRFRYNIHKASAVQSKIKLLEKLPELKPVEKEREVVLKFPKIEPLLPPILQLDEISFRYNADDRCIFRNVSLGATLESRICIVGDNGAGKTTLLKIIMGMLSPIYGVLNVHRNLKFGYFSQHHVDHMNMSQNSVELLRDSDRNSNKSRPIEEYRRQLGSFGITGDMALQSVESLSGGQKSRVAFARMCMAMPNFLVLDEPTNHLDIETIEALAKAINKFNGGVILVSHNERLIRMVCKELWVCGNGTVASIDGGFDEYRRIVQKELADAQTK